MNTNGDPFANLYAKARAVQVRGHSINGIRLSVAIISGGCRSFVARSGATLGTDLVRVEVLGSDHRSRRQRPEIEEEYKNRLGKAL